MLRVLLFFTRALHVTLHLSILLYTYRWVLLYCITQKQWRLRFILIYFIEVPIILVKYELEYAEYLQIVLTWTQPKVDCIKLSFQYFIIKANFFVLKKKSDINFKVKNFNAFKIFKYYTKSKIDFVIFGTNEGILTSFRVNDSNSHEFSSVLKYVSVL